MSESFFDTDEFNTLDSLSPAVEEDANASVDSDATVMINPYDAYLLELTVCCEECALAFEDELDHRLALDALANATVVMASIPGSSVQPHMDFNSQLAGSTQVFSTGLLNAVDSASLVSQEEPSEEQKANQAVVRRRRIMAALLLVLILVASFGAYDFFQRGGFALFEKVTHEMVVSALEESPDVLAGFASNDYVEQDAYTVSDVEILGETEHNDGSVTVDVSYKLDNKFFSSDAEATVDFVRVKDIQFHKDFAGVAIPDDALDTDWISRIEILNNKTRAVTSITHDDDAIGEFNPTFDEEDQTCAYSYSESSKTWLSETKDTYNYTYSFDGNRWARDKFDGPQTTVTYRGIEGPYTPGIGDSGQFNSFRISNLDSSAGTFTISYNKDASSLNNDAIYGEIYCTISREAPTSNYASYKQEDGFVYSFTGTGTSSSGAGTATIYGLFTTDNGFIFDFNGDYTYKPFIFGEEKNDSIALSGSFVFGA